MKNALILHGAGNNSQGNWFPWLKTELEKQRWLVWSPDLPQSDHPDQSSWLNTVLDNPNWQFDQDSVLIGHSSGATLILRILEQLPPGLVINKAVLVAAPVEMGTKPQYYKYKESLLAQPFNWPKIKSSCLSFYFIYSDNDPYDCGKSQGEILNQNLGGELIIRNGEGHFNLEAGERYNRFPLLLEIMQKDT